MNRRNFIKLAGGGVVFAAGAFATYRYMQKNVFGMPQSALESWDTAGNYTDPLKYVLSYAILAPNPHNMQPWIADLRIPGEISIKLDTHKLLPETDPFGRQILVGLGCFIELLSIAATTIGKTAEVQLFPDGEPGQFLDDRRVAVIRLTDSKTEQKDTLFDSIHNRRTDRRSYDLRRGIEVDVINKILQKSNSESLSIGIEIENQKVDKIREIAKRAWEIEMTTPETIMESFHVLRVGTKEIAEHRDGLSLTDPFVVSLEKLGLFDRKQVPAKDSFATTSQIEEFDNITSSTPGYLWIITTGNDRTQQVKSGRVYARANLAANSFGLSMHPNSQALQEYEGVSKEYEAIHNLLDAPSSQYTVQMLARVGYPFEGSGDLIPAPRRKLETFLIN